MLNYKKRWLTIAIINLSIVALLGVVLRCKIIFYIPGIDFKNFLQSHSHFAFGGWITLCLLSLMTFELLPEHLYNKQIYKWLLTGVLFCAYGMLISFPFEGYAFISILFSTLFIFVTYGYAWVFIRDVIKSKPAMPVMILSIGAMTALVLSSTGPFTLAYILASHSVNTLLYRDSIYTYLHLQYNGFFTLGVFALLLNYMRSIQNPILYKNAKRFAIMLSICVLPTLALSYLWHFENSIIRLIANVGCICLTVTIVLFFLMMRSSKLFFKTLNPFVKIIGLLSMIAFVLKTSIQIGLIFPSVAKAVFGDRPLIIGYLHLVMLGFVTLYLLSHLFYINYFNRNNKAAKTGVIIFASGVIVNELILMIQGLTAMIMISSTIYKLLLLIVSIWLLSGAAIIAVASMKNLKEGMPYNRKHNTNNAT